MRGGSQGEGMQPGQGVATRQGLTCAPKSSNAACACSAVALAPRRATGAALPSAQKTDGCVHSILPGCSA